jgi:NTE family protein
MKRSENKKKVALVIGSGGIKCAAVIGVMKVLEKNNIELSLVVGCSGGAVFGAAVALGFPPEKMEETRAKTWTSDVTKRFSYKSLVKILFPWIAGFNDEIGIFDDSVMLGNIENAFGASTSFNDTLIPFHCIATDFESGEPVVISEGTLAAAIRASSAIPLIFKPVRLNDKLLFDGGLSNPIPVDVAIQEGADLIIAVGFELPIRSSINSPVSYAMQMVNIQVNHLSSTLSGYYNLAHHSEIITIIPEFKDSIKVNDVHKVPYIINEGEKEAEKQIKYIKKILSI